MSHKSRGHERCPERLRSPTLDLATFQEAQYALSSILLILWCKLLHERGHMVHVALVDWWCQLGQQPPAPRNTRLATGSFARRRSRHRSCCRVHHRCPSPPSPARLRRRVVLTACVLGLQLHQLLATGLRSRGRLGPFRSPIQAVEETDSLLSPPSHDSRCHGSRCCRRGAGTSAGCGSSIAAVVGVALCGTTAGAAAGAGRWLVPEAALVPQHRRGWCRRPADAAVRHFRRRGRGCAPEACGDRRGRRPRGRRPIVQ
mmetsp:Transcript_162025/g.519498  ORF Transcript_162025/g.519498 Transcript_162025/m.519498 type:complete len:258 (+) Transcript_162025:128-901(+)